MTEAATISFRDSETSEEAVAIVRYNENQVALCISLKSNGDVETVMRKEDAVRLVEALKKALA